MVVVAVVEMMTVVVTVRHHVVELRVQTYLYCGGMERQLFQMLFLGGVYAHADHRVVALTVAVVVVPLVVTHLFQDLEAQVPYQVALASRDQALVLDVIHRVTQHVLDSLDLLETSKILMVLQYWSPNLFI